MTGDDPYGAITVSKGIVRIIACSPSEKKTSGSTDVQVADHGATRFAESDLSNGSLGFLT
jgi:hypothetical protein